MNGIKVGNGDSEIRIFLFFFDISFESSFSPGIARDHYHTHMKRLNVWVTSLDDIS